MWTAWIRRERTGEGQRRPLEACHLNRRLRPIRWQKGRRPTQPIIVASRPPCIPSSPRCPTSSWRCHPRQMLIVPLPRPAHTCHTGSHTTASLPHRVALALTYKKASELRFSPHHPMLAFPLPNPHPPPPPSLSLSLFPLRLPSPPIQILAPSQGSHLILPYPLPSLHMLPSPLQRPSASPTPTCHRHHYRSGPCSPRTSKGRRNTERKREKGRGRREGERMTRGPYHVNGFYNIFM